MNDKSVIDAMNKYVVLSLHTDFGPDAAAYSRLREELTGSATIPMYVLRDPFDDKVMRTFDYNQAKAADFGARIESGRRQFSGRQARRGPVGR